MAFDLGRSRYLKAACEGCGYRVSTTRVHLRDGGPPLCPRERCTHYREPMACPDWEGLYQDELESWGEIVEAETAYTMIRETERRAGKLHDCSGCSTEIVHSERYRERVYTLAGELHHERHCLRCILTGGAGWGRGKTMRA